MGLADEYDFLAKVWDEFLFNNAVNSASMLLIDPNLPIATGDISGFVSRVIGTNFQSFGEDTWGSAFVSVEKADFARLCQTLVFTWMVGISASPIKIDYPYAMGTFGADPVAFSGDNLTEEQAVLERLKKVKVLFVGSLIYRLFHFGQPWYVDGDKVACLNAPVEALRRDSDSMVPKYLFGQKCTDSAICVVHHNLSGAFDNGHGRLDPPISVGDPISVNLGSVLVRYNEKANRFACGVTSLSCGIPKLNKKSSKQAATVVGQTPLGVGGNVSTSGGFSTDYVSVIGGVSSDRYYPYIAAVVGCANFAYPTCSFVGSSDTASATAANAISNLQAPGCDLVAYLVGCVVTDTVTPSERSSATVWSDDPSIGPETWCLPFLTQDWNKGSDRSILAFSVGGASTDTQTGIKTYRRFMQTYGKKGTGYGTLSATLTLRRMSATAWGSESFNRNLRASFEIHSDLSSLSLNNLAVGVRNYDGHDGYDTYNDGRLHGNYGLRTLNDSGKSVETSVVQDSSILQESPSIFPLIRCDAFPDGCVKGCFAALDSVATPDDSVIIPFRSTYGSTAGISNWTNRASRSDWHLVMPLAILMTRDGSNIQLSAPSHSLSHDIFSGFVRMGGII